MIDERRVLYKCFNSMAIQIKRAALLLGIFFAGPHAIRAQGVDCNFKPPILTVDFGSRNNVPGIYLSALRNYRNVGHNCPNDGHYSFSSETSDCFNGTWHTINEDHTPNDDEGNMMLINAAYQHGLFFYSPINGLKGNTMYEFSVYLVNVCRIRTDCPPLPPNIIITLQTAAGKVIGNFETGQLVQGYAPKWKKYTGLFTMPPEETTLLLKMENITDGGCGNDFAMDDITLRECVQLQPVKEKRELVLKPVIKQKPAIAKPVVNEKKPAAKPLSKPDPRVSKVSVNTTLQDIARPVVKEKPNRILMPNAILTRANPVIKKIETPAAEMVIDLYDNGEIDGDTVSIYHNNELIVSRARLSAKPVSFKVTVDSKNPHHEVVMVANNLGSIPPNTSLMIITARGKRYEVFISSSEEKNAKIVIDWQE